MSRSVFSVFVAVFALLFVGLAAAANPPLLIPLQGKLLNSTGSVLSGSHSLNFTLYDAATSGVQVWQEVRTGTNNYSFANGLFDVQLGDNTSLVNVTFNQSLWLEINVSGEILAPRMRLGASPFAIGAERLFGVENSLNESLITLNKTGAATGAGALLNIVENVGTGPDIQALGTFNVTNGEVHGINLTVSQTGGSGIRALLSTIEAANFLIAGPGTYTGQVISAAFKGNGSAINSLDASQLTNGTIPDGRIAGFYPATFATWNNLRNQFYGDGTGLNFSYVNATGTLPDSNLSGPYSNGLEFKSTNNNYTGNKLAIRNANDAGNVDLAVDVIHYLTTALLGRIIQTTNNDGLNILHNNTGPGSALNVTTMGSDEALGVQQYGNAAGVIIEKLGAGAGTALSLENSGTGAILTLQATANVGNGGARIASSTGNGSWIGTSSHPIYANGSVDKTHGADMVQIDNSAVTGNSIILLSINGSVSPGVPVSLYVSARSANNHFNVTAVNASSRTGDFTISYIVVN